MLRFFRNSLLLILIVLIGLICTAEKASSAENSSELRGIWVTRFEWASPKPDVCKKNIREYMKKIADANFNAVFFQVRGSAETLYPSDLEPWSHLLGVKDPGFDPLEMAIQEAHKYGLQFHAYINPMPMVIAKKNVSMPTDPNHMYNLHGPKSSDPWICMKKDGSPMDGQAASYYYFSAGIPEVQTYLRKVVKDLVSRYQIDGLHVDRIRYPGKQYSYDSISKARFAGSGNPLVLDWADWTREQLNKLVNDMYAQAVSIRPDIIVSCAAWGIYNRHHIDGYAGFSSGFHDYYQDSWRWVKDGSMDWIVPMIYWDMNDPKPNYDQLVLDFIKGVGADKLIGGQKIYGQKSLGKENDREIQFTRDQDCVGTVLFSYSSLSRKAGFDKLKETVYAKKAALPEVKMKANYDSGLIYGYVVDELGLPVTDCWVSLYKDGGKKPLKTWVSSSDGYFAFLKIPAGNVYLTAEYPGCKKIFSGGIEVPIGQTKEVSLTLNNVSSFKKKPFLQILNLNDGQETSSEKIHMMGRTVPGTSVKMNGKELEVYGTGSFVSDNNMLKVGPNEWVFELEDQKGRKMTRTFTVVRTEAKAKPVKKQVEEAGSPIAPSLVYPDKNQTLLAGDELRMQVKYEAGHQLFVRIGTLEVPLTAVNDKSDLYSSVFDIPKPFSLKKSAYRIYSKTKKWGIFPSSELLITSKKTLQVWPSSVIIRSTDDETGIKTGTHSVRLGGPYLSELPAGTFMEAIGKEKGYYKVKLSATQVGYVDDEEAEIVPERIARPHGKFSYCIINGDEKEDRFWIPMSEKVVYALSTEIDGGNKIILDLYNSHLAATWFSHKSGSKWIGDIRPEQVEEDHVRLTIPIKSKQIWGYWMERKGSSLTLHVSRPPVMDGDNLIKGLTFAVEAGHGGSDSGARGKLGTKEKEVNVMAAKALRKELEKRGAKVVFMRPGDSRPNYNGRYAFAINADADLVISLHANAAGVGRGYLSVSGTSTYYKAPHCYLFAKTIYDELLKLGWREYGVVGNFNYWPIRQTRFPSMLVEQAFMSNPSDEARLLDPDYQKNQAVAIADGIQKFLVEVKE